MKLKTRIHTFVGFLMLGASVPHVSAAEFQSAWEGTRPWIGPEYWGTPLYDWETRNGTVEAVTSPGRLLHLLTHRVDDSGKGFKLETPVAFVLKGKATKPAQTRAGFAVGVKGLMDDTRHIAVGPIQRIEAGVRADGKLQLGPEVAEEVLPGTGPVELTLVSNGDSLELTGVREGKTIAMTRKVSPGELAGNICLAAPALNRNHFDWDSNGWPRSGRDRALRPLLGDNTVMLHGDQHPGLFVQQVHRVCRRQPGKGQQQAQSPEIRPTGENRPAKGIRIRHRRDFAGPPLQGEARWTPVASAPII